MTRIPFDIKFRPQIESGEYMVETKDGRKVKIISFECTDTDGCPIAGQFRLCAGTPTIQLFDENGFHRGEGDSDFTLMIIVPDKQEQQEAELKKEIDTLWNPQFSLGWDENSLISINHAGFESIARHFAEWGKNNLK